MSDNKYMEKYYQENKFKFKEYHNRWIKLNKEAWNKYQNWHSKMRYWKNKLKNEPENTEYQQIIEKLLHDKPIKKMQKL